VSTAVFIKIINLFLFIKHKTTSKPQENNKQQQPKFQLLLPKSKKRVEFDLKIGALLEDIAASSSQHSRFFPFGSRGLGFHNLRYL
jgi:hypothetical protein